MLDVDAELRAALDRIMHNIALRLSEHQPKSATFYRRSVGQLYRRKLERERQQGEAG